MSSLERSIVTSFFSNDPNDLHFDRDIREQLFALGRRYEMKPKQRILEEGKTPSEVIIPLNHSLFGVSANNEEKKVEFEVESIIALPEAILGQNLSYSLIADKPSSILIIPFVRIRSLIDHDASLRWKILKYLSFQSLGRESSSEKYLLSDPSARLAQLLLRLSDAYGEVVGNKIQINNKISQDELGARIGVSRQSINKYIKEFVEKNYIEKSGHKLIIVNIDALKNISKI